MRHQIHAALRMTLVTLALCLSITGLAFGQEITGSIVGTVRDSNGNAVKGATVTVTDSEKKVVIRTISTGDDGEYTARDLPVALYDVTVEAPNFKKHVENRVQVDVGRRRNVDITLEAGNIAEVVTVEASPLAVELTTSTVSTVINGDQARELSLNNRNWVQLITLAPGVSNNLADQVYVGTTSPADGTVNLINISVNGARAAQNTYTVDGADVTDRGSNLTIQAYPSVDSIAEFQVQRSLFAAESGRSGGGQINVVTRGGGEKFHGSLFEFLRNERLNANDFITNRNPNPPFGRDSNGKAKRAPFRYNNYGGTIGGPVYFFRFGEGGKMAKKLSRTFFFFSEEQRKDRRYPTLSGTVPDLNMRQGIFPIDICLSAFTASTSGSVPCTNVLPAGTPLSSKVSINPVAQQYLSFVYNKLPPPTDALTRALLFPAVNVADFRQEILRLDHQFSNKVSVYYRFEKDKIPTIDVNSLFSSGSGLPGVSTSSTDSPGKTHTFQATYIASPGLVIVGRWNYGYGAILSHDVGTLALANSPITPPLAYPNTRDMVPNVSGNGFSSLVEFGNYDNFSYKHNFAGDVTWTRGSHTIKFGGQYSRYRKNENALAGTNQGAFSGFLNTAPNSAQQASVQAPNAATQEPNSARRANFQAFANFLQGNNVTFSQAHFDYTADLRQFTVENYAQDEWRFRPNVTIYYGLRYSYFSPPHDNNGRLTNFVPTLFNPAAAPLVTGAGNRVAGTGINFCNGLIANAQNFTTGPAAFNCTPITSPYGKYVIKPTKKDFGPRIGLAWDPFKKGKTSIRTGYGIYYDQIKNGSYEDIIGRNPPYQETFTVSAIASGSAATTPTLNQPVPSGVTVVAGAAATAASIRAFEVNWKDPYMQHWSLELQQQFGNNTLLSVGYFGSKGTHLIGSYEINEVPPGKALNTLCASGSSTTPTVACQAAGTYFGGTTGGVSSNILDQIRPFRGWRSINMISPQFNSNYHSLQTQLAHRFGGAGQFNVAYTWSKNITDNQNDSSTAPENSFNVRLDRGRASLDRRHIFTTNYIYDLPFFRKRHDLVGNVLGGWEVSGLVTLQSGLPFTPSTNFDAAGLGNIPALVAGNRPNILCDPNSGGAQTFEQWFNITCTQPNPTAAPVANVVGNAGRGIIQGPPTKRVDFSLFKNIRFGEHTRLQLRGEAFNIFNHTNFRAINVTTTSGTYGFVTTVRDPRNIQLGVKLIF